MNFSEFIYMAIGFAIGVILMWIFFLFVALPGIEDKIKDYKMRN